MLQPDVGQLLRELRIALDKSVLPAVSEPGAKRQLKAALHLLGRLSRTWDLPQALVVADNADMVDTISRIEAQLSAEQQIAPTPYEIASLDQLAPLNGVNDPALSANLARNLILRTSLEALEQRLRDLPTGAAKSACLSELHALFARMTVRESMLAGDAPLESPQE